MNFSLFPRSAKLSKSKGQAMVEFAIALPVLLFMLFGIMEFGRLIFTYVLVTNASRDAVRYASAYGRGDDGYLKYKDCSGIKNAARQSAYVTSLTTITITYDSGPSGTSKGSCTASSGEDSSISVDSGDRVIVTVTGHYSRIVKFLPIPDRDITSKSARTILGIYDLKN